MGLRLGMRSFAKRLSLQVSLDSPESPITGTRRGEMAALDRLLPDL